MRNFDLLFLDMDGTLLKNDHLTVSDRNRAALKAAQAAGVKLVVATGRCLCILPSVVEEIGFDYALTSNGASVVDLKTGEEIYHKVFPPEAARLAYEVASPDCEFIEFFASGKLLLSKASRELARTREIPIWHRLYLEKGDSPVVETDWDYLNAGAPGLEKICLVRYEREVISRIHRELTQSGQFTLSASIGKSMEINAAGCTKGSAIVGMCEALGVEISRTAAMGDASNDLDMMRAAGCSVAMGNASDEVKALAKMVTATNEEDGVAEFIEKFVI